MTNSTLIKRSHSIPILVIFTVLCAFYIALSIQPVDAAGGTVAPAFEPSICAVTLTPTSRNFGPDGGTGTVDITSQCEWTVAANVPWITVTGPPTGAGIGQREFTVAPNPDPLQRTGTITIGDKTFTVSQLGTTCPVIFPMSANIPTGATVDTFINVGDLTGLGYVSYTLDVSFDPTVVSFAGVDTAGTLSSGFTVGGNLVSPGNLRIAGFGTSPLSSSGILIKVRFTAIGAVGSSTPTDFTSIQFNEGGCWQTIGGPGTISIVGRSVAGSVVYAHTGVGIESILISAYGDPGGSSLTDANGAYSITGLGTGPLTLFPSFLLNTPPPANGITALDASAVLQHVLGVTILNANQLLAAEVSGNGSVTAFDAALIAKYAVGAPDTAFTGSWIFSPSLRSYTSLPSNLTGQNFALILRGEVTGNWAPPAPSPAEFAPVIESKDDTSRAPAIRITSPTLAVQRGAVTIPITLGSYNGQIITAYQFDLVYDPNVVVPDVEPVDLTGTLSSSFAFAFNSAEPGRLRIAVYGASSIPADGTLLNLRFNVIGLPKSRTDLSLNALVLNEGQPAVSIANGKLTVKR